MIFKIVWLCIVTDSLWIKPTDALNSNSIGIIILHVSGSLSAHHQEFLAVYWLWYILCRCDNRLLPANGSSQLRKVYQSQCTAKNSWWWAERLPETCRVVIIPIKLEFSVSVGFIHKEFSVIINTNYLFHFWRQINFKYMFCVNLRFNWNIWTLAIFVTAG